MGVRVTSRAALAVLLLAVAAAAPVHAETFLSSVDDLPLMPGLQEKTAAAVLFDSPAGRIAEAQAEGNVSADSVIAFYAATLPELGWAPVAPTLYRRDGETLRLDLAPGRPLTVRFTVTPGDAP